MSNLIPSPDVSVSIPPSSAGPAIEAFPSRKAEVGVLSVRRALPVRQRRTIGPWCFFDHFGPIEFIDGKPMDVAPHPHIGLQTVSWLFQGLVLHRDSLGSRQLIRPGDLNLMTAGLSEISLSPAGGRVLARFFVIGGVPFGEPLLMWWNFVARNGEEITRARADWAAGRFPEVRGYPGSRLAAPPLPPVPLRPR